MSQNLGLATTRIETAAHDNLSTPGLSLPRTENGEAEHTCSASFSDVDLLGHGKRVVHLDPEITHSALDLRVAQ